MLKTLMVTTALTGLVIGAAVAEGTPPAPSSPSPPAAQSSPPAMPPAKSPEMTSPAPSTAAAEKPASGSAKFINSQRSDQFLASKFKGTDVVGNDNEKIGDISDILFDKSGKIEAYVLGVGGFLGIGAKDVALAPTAFQVVPGDKSKNESDKLKLGMTKDELKQAATFEPYKAPSATTGMGGGPAQRPAPAGGGMAR
jgi:sporulation protein YlmC with PRC-barrel domain